MFSSPGFPNIPLLGEYGQPEKYQCHLQALGQIRGLLLEKQSGVRYENIGETGLCCSCKVRSAVPVTVGSWEVRASVLWFPGIGILPISLGEPHHCGFLTAFFAIPISSFCLCVCVFLSLFLKF